MSDMARLGQSAINRIKSALTGDMSRYSSDQYQDWLSHAKPREIARTQGPGRIYSGYGAYEVEEKPVAKPITKAKAKPKGLFRVFAALRSIGEYDLERTR